MKKFFFLILGVFLLTSCSKEYEIEIERIEMYGSEYYGIDMQTYTVKAKNDEEAAQDAFLQYLSSIRTAHTMQGDSFYWIPVDYTIKDEDGNTVSRELNAQQNQLLFMTPDIAEWYIEMLGYKFLGTPYYYVYKSDKEE